MSQTFNLRHFQSEIERRTYAEAERIGREVEELNHRIMRNRRQWAADEAAERLSESRTRSPNAQRTNIHE